MYQSGLVGFTIIRVIFYAADCSKLEARCFYSGKCCHNSIENDYCGGKPGLSPPLLILTLTLTLNPNPNDVTKPNHNPTDPTNPNRLATNPSWLDCRLTYAKFPG